MIVGLDNGRGFFFDFEISTLYCYVVDCDLLFLYADFSKQQKRKRIQILYWFGKNKSPTPIL
jgi:hypothetical protein